jgi:hypothetical protein
MDRVHEFGSLSACLRFLSSEFSGTARVTGKSQSSGSSLGYLETPAFLFRGEATRYATTTPTIQRLPHDTSLCERERKLWKLLPGISNLLTNDLAQFFAMSPMDAAGFAQHYGLPTELVDLTANSNVAGFFASTAKIGTKGYVAVFPFEHLARHSVLIDVSNHAKAHRPRLQAAYAVFCRQNIDLKSDASVAELKSRWFGFTLTEEDRALYQANSALLDAHLDPVAGALQLLIDSMVQKYGKLPDTIARWLSDRVAVAPFVTRVVRWWPNGTPAEVELVSSSELGFVFDEVQERQRSYRFWSAAFDARSRDEA